MVNPTVISTFAGGGGSSLGYKWAGFNELLAIDFDKNSCDTLKANFKFPVWQRDITEITAEEILTFCKIQKGELDVLDGSPPCQGFSTAGKRNLNDSRNDLFLDFVRLIDGLQPKVFVMENVSGMVKGGYKGKFNEILQTLKNTGYNVKVKLMNAMWYEVPQSRERVFFIGVRGDLGIEPEFPKPCKGIITVKTALMRCISKTFSKDTKSSLEILYKKRNGIKLTSYFNFVIAKNNKPAPTMLRSVKYCGPGYYHPIENRSISIEEAKRLCSFPDSYRLTGKFNEQWSGLGNAVMPKMMYHIAKHLKENILIKLNGKAIAWK